jgi:hypothetical protein
LVEVGALRGSVFRVPCSVMAELWRRIQGKRAFFSLWRFERCGGQNKLLSKLPKALIDVSLSRISCDTKKAREHTNDVAVQNGFGLIEGNAADSAGGIAANARQGQQIIKVFREFAPVQGNDGLRGLLHITNASVVAQAFPELVNSLRAGFGQGSNIWQRLHPPLPKGEDRFDLGLLEHDFGNPDGVRIMRATPGQITGMPAEPLKQKGDDSGQGF